MTTKRRPDQRPPRTRLPALAAVATATLALAAGGCLDDELDPAEGPTGAGIFIALQRDFQSFRSWTRVQVGEAVVAGGHTAGPRFAYVSSSPAGRAFPVGAIIIKTVETGDPQTWTIHARVKRGGGFNLQGAIDWEWFDLRIAPPTGETVIMWRGSKPPTNHGYESLPGLGTTSSMDGDCNSCHMDPEARAWDFTLAAPVRQLFAP